ncbi:MAG: BPSL0067 family protein [Dolichospermum sp. DL01]|nr:MAG: BPSL0067 family protein [Dolichospermum sp. DL01]
MSDYQDPLYSNPSNSAQLPVPFIDTVVQAIDATKYILSGLSGNSQRDYIMGTAFGLYNQDSANPILTDWAQNNFTNTPHIELVFGQNFNGAFAKENNTIYLSQEFVAANQDNVGAVTGVLVEEVGHSLDSQINVQDAAGDEGDIFSRLLRGQSISAGELVSLKAEDDTATININGKDTAVEMSKVAMELFNNRIYQSVRGTDNGIYNRSSADGTNWTAWQNLGGATLGGPDLEVFNGRLYQSVRGTDNGIYNRSSVDGTNWTAWQNFGGATLSGPDLEVFNGRLYQSVRGTDNGIYNRSSVDGTNWTAWQNFGGATLSGPDLEVFNGRLYQSVRGTDNGIYNRSSVDGTTWTAWQNFGGATLSGPDLEVFNGRLYQSVRGTDNGIYNRSSVDGTTWTAWQNFGGATLADPELEVFNGKLFQAVQGTDNAIYTRYSSNGTNWNVWEERGGLTPADALSNPVTPPPIVTPPPSGLMTTSTNLTKLINGQLNGTYIDVDGAYGAQCWDLVAYATGINGSSSYWNANNWKAGENVMSNGNVAVGTAIATFLGPNGSYYSSSGNHTAIFAGYGSENGVAGFYVWDQNWNLSGNVAIKKHFVANNKSGTSDADNYYLIRV